MSSAGHRPVFEREAGIDSLLPDSATISPNAVGAPPKGTAYSISLKRTGRGLGKISWLQRAVAALGISRENMP